MKGVTMMQAYIHRRNIEKLRRMLDEETDESSRRAIESLIREFEGMSSVLELGERRVEGDRGSSRDSGKS
jgi:hypothetical protein